MKKNTRYVCPHCGFDGIEAEAWADINTETVNSFAEGGDNYCGNCEQHFRGWCEVDAETGKCVNCWFGDPKQHDKDDFKPLENMRLRSEAKQIDEAGRLLKQARDLLQAAGTPKTVQRVRLALSSLRGALSNAHHREQRPGRKRIRRAQRLKIVSE